MKLILFVILCISLPISSFCQAIQFKSKINQDHFIFTSADTIEIKVLKFYIAKLQFWRKGKLVQTDKKRAYLIDVLKDATTIIHYKKSADSLSFILGVDSLIQKKGAMGAGLDPSNGMYWTWQSGYIHFKLEAITNGARNLQLHIGGYSAPHNTIQAIGFPINRLKNNCIQFDLLAFLKHIDLSNTKKIMSPCAEAVLISSYIAQSFSICHD